MAEFQTPGAYVAKIARGPAPIRGVDMGTLGLVGRCERAVQKPALVTSLREFETTLGTPIGDSCTWFAVKGFFDNGGQRCFVSCAAGSRSSFRAALTALGSVSEVALVAVPDEHAIAGLQSDVIDHCERTPHQFGVLSVPEGTRSAATLPIPKAASHSAMYGPWLEARGARGATRVPPVGHVAGVFARTEKSQGIHKAPANEVVDGIEGLEFSVSSSELGRFTGKHVNMIRDLRSLGRGIRIWGARTLSADPEWKYVNVRRFVTFIERSVESGTRWAVFEPNDETLWALVRQQVEAFLTTQWRMGALQGAKPDDAYFVKCDRTTTTQQDIDSGRLVCIIGVAPLKPAEFVIIRFTQKTARS